MITTEGGLNLTYLVFPMIALFHTFLMSTENTKLSKLILILNF